MFASCNRYPDVILTLLKAGAVLEDRDKAGWTTLMCAARYSPNPEVVTTLLKAGADVKAASKEGKRAVDYARDNEKLKDTDAYQELEKASQ